MPGRVRGYLVDKHGKAQSARFYDASNKYPAGGFTASAEHCLRFAIAVGTGHVLQPKTLDQTWTAQTTTLGTKSPFGLGWGVVERQSRKMVGFNGLQPMTETSLRYFPDKGDGVALFCNAEGAQGFSELLDSITEILTFAIIPSVLHRLTRRRMETNNRDRCQPFSYRSCDLSDS